MTLGVHQFALQAKLENRFANLAERVVPQSRPVKDLLPSFHGQDPNRTCALGSGHSIIDVRPRDASAHALLSSASAGNV
jgi:hypothetical protein